MMTDCFIAARAIHFGACLLAFALFTFDCFIFQAIRLAAPAGLAAQRRKRLRKLYWMTLPVLLLSGAVWFICVAMTMSGLSLSDTLKPQTLGEVWRQTQFGAVWQFRSVVLALAVFATAMVAFRPAIHTRLRWLELLLTASLLGSLAWAGHGQEGHPPGLHLSADTVHLLAAGFWPTGLLPLALCLRQLCGDDEPRNRQLIVTLVNRFSAFSLLSVALLVVTGWINSWYLVGSIHNLFHQRYGQWLVLKLILFLITVAIGALNLLRLKPRLASDDPATLARLRANVLIELCLSTAIILVVGILGILPPAIQ